MSILKTNGKKIEYLKEGNGEKTFVLVHGWRGSAKSTLGLHELIKKNNTSVIFDLPGFGDSENPDSDWGVVEYAELVVSLIKNLELGSVILFGHSFGGALSVYIAAKHPEIVNKLVLCAPSFNREKVSKENKTSGIKSGIGVFTGSSFYKRLKPRLRFIRKIFYKIFYPKSDLFVHPHLESNFKKIVKQDLTPLLQDIKQRTLILWGKKDSYVPIEHAYVLNENIKSSKLVVHNSGGHHLPKFQLDWVYNEIMKFL